MSTAALPPPAAGITIGMHTDCEVALGLGKTGDSVQSEFGEEIWAFTGALSTLSLPERSLAVTSYQTAAAPAGTEPSRYSAGVTSEALTRTKGPLSLVAR